MRDDVQEILQRILSEVPADAKSDEHVSKRPTPAEYEQVCEYVQRNLTWPEWQRFVVLFPYERTCPDLPVHFSVINRIRELRLHPQTIEADKLLQHVVTLDPEFPRVSNTNSPSLVINLPNTGLSASFSSSDYTLSFKLA